MDRVPGLLQGSDLLRHKVVTGASLVAKNVRFAKRNVAVAGTAGPWRSRKARAGNIIIDTYIYTYIYIYISVLATIDYACFVYFFVMSSYYLEAVYYHQLIQLFNMTWRRGACTSLCFCLL